MENIPEAEKLSRRERLAHFGRDVLRALVRNTEAFSGTPDEYQRVQRGISEAENFANQQKD